MTTSGYLPDAKFVTTVSLIGSDDNDYSVRVWHEDIEAPLELMLRHTLRLVAMMQRLKVDVIDSATRVESATDQRKHGHVWFADHAAQFNKKQQ